jgi:hypothetical protein
VKARFSRAAAAAVLGVALLASCSRPHMRAPDGFAPIDGGQTLRALSPEGMRVEARKIRNRPRQEVAFWTEALRTQLARDGYRAAGEPQTFKAKGREGRYFEWAVPYGTESWSYLTAIVVAGRRILVVEAAGEKSLYQKHRAALLASLETLAP